MNGTDIVIRASTGIHKVDGQLAITPSIFRRKNKYTGLTICLRAGYESHITNFNWRLFGHQRAPPGSARVLQALHDLRSLPIK